jgi:hypothetical protein
VDASVRGAGKGKLARVCLIPSLGPGGCTVAALPREEEETRKALTAYLRERRLAVVFDNVAGRIGSAVLAKALTEPVWDDRTLGKSESVRYPVRCVWVVTANNPSYSDEIGRRLVPIRLVPQTDRPELREGFKHPELEAWVTANRADLLWSLAVFVRAWQAAGCPAPHARLGSYETWTRVVGGILETVGYTDLLANREEILAAADPDTAAWESFLAAWWETHEDRYVAVRDLLALAEPHGVRVNGDGDRAQSASLGMALGSRRDRFFGVWQVKKGEGSRRREWRLHRPMTPSVTYDTSPSNSLRGGKTISNDAMQITLPRYTPGKEVAEVSEGVMSHADALALTWGRVVEAEERLEREAIQAEAAA